MFRIQFVELYRAIHIIHFAGELQPALFKINCKSNQAHFKQSYKSQLSKLIYFLKCSESNLLNFIAIHIVHFAGNCSLHFSRSIANQHISLHFTKKGKHPTLIYHVWCCLGKKFQVVINIKLCGKVHQNVTYLYFH